MGWNQLHFKENEELRVKSEELRPLENGLFKGFTEGEFVYFVHSFYVPVCTQTIATTNYILPFSAALHKDNFYATQFHPEKSGSVGERIIKNFLEL
jgi:glutamine amidotransferase